MVTVALAVSLKCLFHLYHYPHSLSPDSLSSSESIFSSSHNTLNSSSADPHVFICKHTNNKTAYYLGPSRAQGSSTRQGHIFHAVATCCLPRAAQRKSSVNIQKIFTGIQGESWICTLHQIPTKKSRYIKIYMRKMKP